MINKVELASNLADRELENIYGDDDFLWEIDEESGSEVYTEENQGRYNALYDEFYSMIEECEYE